jgi:hypothetical protein
MSELAQADRIRSNAGTTTAVPPREAQAKAAPSAKPAPSKDRVSPDPAHHTDRYRLVTPFALRL